MKDVQELELMIEEHENCLYAWNKRTNTFMGQSTTVQGLMRRLAEDIAGQDVSVVIKIAAEDGGSLLKRRAALELELAESQDSAVLDIDAK